MFTACGLQGPLSTHAMRKTYAKNIYPQINRDLVDTQKALGHAWISSTVRYLDADDDRITKAQLAL